MDSGTNRKTFSMIGGMAVLYFFSLVSVAVFGTPAGIDTTERKKWKKRIWQETETVPDAQNNRAYCKIPDDAVVHYTNLTDERTLRVSSEHFETQ